MAAGGGKFAKIESDLGKIPDVEATLKWRSVAKDQFQLVIVSEKETSQKLPKDAVLLICLDGNCSRKDGPIVPWEPTPKTKAYNLGTKNETGPLTMGKIVSLNPTCKSVYGCMPPAHKAQTWKQEGDQQRGFVLTPKANANVGKAITLAAGLKTCTVLWRVKVSKDAILEPRGLVIMSTMGQKVSFSVSTSIHFVVRQASYPNPSLL